MTVADDAARALAIVRECTLLAPKQHRSFIDDEGENVEIDYRPPCRYTDVAAELGHERARAALRALELDGAIVWLGSGVLFPNEFPWSQFARRTLARRDGDAGPAGRRVGDVAGEVRSEPASGGRGA